MSFATGEILAHNLDSILARLATTECIHPCDQVACNQCCSDDDDIPLQEFSGPLRNSLTFKILESMSQSITTNPMRRSHVVDWPEGAEYGEDSIWLSLPKWMPDIQWSVCTVKTLDRSCFHQLFDQSCGYKLDLMQHGSALATDASTGSRSFYSDQPRLVTRYGRDLARSDTSKPCIRVFRCAPRPCIKRGIQSVLTEPPSDHMFDLWIRHFDLSDGIDDIGTFQHAVDDKVDLLELLTDVNMVINIRKSPINRYISPPKAPGSERKEQYETNAKPLSELPSKEMTSQRRSTTAHDDVDTSWLELLELEPDSPYATPGKVTVSGENVASTETAEGGIQNKSKSSFGTPASSSIFPANKGLRVQFDESVLHPMMTALDSRQKHLNKLNHLSPILESPFSLLGLNDSIQHPEVSPAYTVGQTPASSPSESYTKFPWYTPVPTTPVSSQSRVGVSAELLLSELAAIVGGDSIRSPLAALTPAKRGKKLFATRVNDENRANR